MERAQKESQIATLREDIARAQSLVISDFRGLTVEVDTALRRDFRSQGCQYKVIKNTLLELAVKGTKLEGISKYLAGPTAIAYSPEDPVLPAKIALKWSKDQEKFVVKGGYVDGNVLDAKGVEDLSKMAGKDELRATLLATFLAAPQGFVRLINAAPQNFAYLLVARERALGGGAAA
jgi:large subunit ribosomal protein L10